MSVLIIIQYDKFHFSELILKNDYKNNAYALYISIINFLFYINYKIL